MPSSLKSHYEFAGDLTYPRFKTPIPKFLDLRTKIVTENCCKSLVEIGEPDLKRAEDGHEPIAGDGGEGEDTGHHAHHRVERVQFAEYGWKEFWGHIQCKQAIFAAETDPV